MSKRQQDARIAKELGWTDVNKLKYESYGIPPGGDESVIGLSIPTYASDPSPPSEWEIMQWVKKQDLDFRIRFSETLLMMSGILDESFLSFVSIGNELGDWANALLEVLDE